jgi:hypothetical protein
MRLVQHLTDGGNRCVSVALDNQTLARINGTDSVYALAHRAAAENSTIVALAEEFMSDERLDYQAIIDSGHILPPIDHPVDAAHCMVSGTGLTYLGNGAARERLIARFDEPISAAKEPAIALLADGYRNGKPEDGSIGGQPEWFYKGDGQHVVASGADVPQPSFAMDCGDEAEIAALYIVDDTGFPCRVGYALANEFTDHQMDETNVLYTGHAKLRHCALGPELVLGELPADITGHSRVVRGRETVWEKSFRAGSDHLTHSLHNLEHHHFKYASFRRAGDVHIHCLGAATSSFSDGFATRPGDHFEVSAEGFGRALTSTVRVVSMGAFGVKVL